MMSIDRVNMITDYKDYNDNRVLHNHHPPPARLISLITEFQFTHSMRF